MGNFLGHFMDVKLLNFSHRPSLFQPFIPHLNKQSGFKAPDTRPHTFPTERKEFGWKWVTSWDISWM